MCVFDDCFIQERTSCYQLASHDEEDSLVSMATEGSYVAGAAFSVSITNRLISIKVLVQEEALEPFRSVGSCATEEQSKCVIAVHFLRTLFVLQINKKILRGQKFSDFQVRSETFLHFLFFI